MSLPEDLTRRFFAIEGIDGAGKTTQAQALARWLEDEKGEQAVVYHEPTQGPIGAELRRLARQGREALSPQREFEMFLEDRQWDVKERIVPALEAGKVVIMDRYYFSSIAYQGALGLDPAEIQRANEEIAPRPEVVFLLDLPVTMALTRIDKRGGEGRNLFERQDYQEKVAEVFHSLTDPILCRIDATESPEAVQNNLRAKVVQSL